MNIDRLTPDIILHLKQNDIKAFEKIYRAFYKPLTRFAMQYVHDQDEAENIVQEVMYRLWQNRKQLNPQKNLKTYLFTAVKNRALTLLKHKKVRQDYSKQLLSVQFDSDTPERIFQNKELAEAIEISIAALPEKCRRVFCMNRFENLTYKEIASVQGVTVKAVEKQMTRAFKLLRKHLSVFLTNLL